MRRFRAALALLALSLLTAAELAYMASNDVSYSSAGEGYAGATLTWVPGSQSWKLTTHNFIAQ